MPGGTTVTGGYLFKDPPKYYEEAATGFASVITNASASGIFGLVQGIEIDVDPDTQEFRKVGSEDPYANVIGKVGVKWRITFGIVNTSSTFMNLCTKPEANASSDISRPIHIVWSQRLADTGSTQTTTYYALRGCRPNSISFDGKAGSPITAVVEGFAHSLTFTAVASAFQATGFAAEPSDAPWNYEDGGASPITIFGNAGHNVTEFSWTVDRGIKPIYVLGASNVAKMPPTIRSITGNFMVIHESVSSFIADSLLTATVGTISWVMKTSAGTPVFSSATLISHSLPQTVADETYERIGFRCLNMSTY